MNRITTPPPSHIQANNTMGAPFDFAAERPDHIEQILNGLDRYNPETTAVFQDYVMQQCENQTYDCYANLALLKLYVPIMFYEKTSAFYDEKTTTMFPIIRGVGD
jgi:translation initiation factor 3 subunit K